MLPEFLLIDKPADCTSFDVIRDLRRALGEKRIGHLGTLDPFATGLLILACGTATRLLPALQALPKTYDALARLGAVSTTEDPEGDVTETGGVIPTRRAVDAALAAFRGEIQQRPSAHSAVKIDGQRAYARARRGEEVEMPLRTVTIHALEATRFDPPELAFTVTCSTGTYVRALARDLGEALGCGAYLTQLRRTAIGPHLVDAAAAPSAPLAGARSSRAVLQGVLPIVDLDQVALTELSFGRSVPAPGVPDGDVALARGACVVALASVRGGRAFPHAVRPDALAEQRDATYSSG